MVRLRESLGGGGTITMQVVRNYVLSFERTYIRKLREIILAWQLEDHLTKQEIFELYFNKAFLGNRNYGFAAAYQYYFGKDFQKHQSQNLHCLLVCCRLHHG